MKRFLTIKDFPLKQQPIPVKVYQDYDRLDRVAFKRGYEATECRNDQAVGYRSGCGAKNNHLHSGWIATMGDSSHKVQDQIDLLNEKVATIAGFGVELIVGFCQTGHFSVGYSIYTRMPPTRWLITDDITGEGRTAIFKDHTEIARFNFVHDAHEYVELMRKKGGRHVVETKDMGRETDVQAVNG